MNSTYDCIENERKKKEREEHPSMTAYHDKAYDENHRQLSCAYNLD